MAWIITGMILVAAILFGFSLYRNYQKKIRLELYKETTKYKQSLEEQKENALRDYRQLDESLKEKVSLTNQIIQKQEQLIDTELKNYRDTKTAQMMAEIQELDEKLKTESLEKKMDLEMKILEIQKQLEDYLAKRRATNEAIMRERAIEEARDFYRINLKPEELDDISHIKSILSQLHNKQIVSKLIYEVFYKGPLAELLGRILNGKKVAGIYKITDMRTQEAYIGRSVDVANRLTEHVKSTLGIGGIADQRVHEIMNERGIENFSFQLLEECGKDELASREKYYINFFETDTIGWNRTKGG